MSSLPTLRVSFSPRLLPSPTLRLCAKVVLVLVFAATAGNAQNAIERARNIVDEVVAKSFPELSNTDIEIREFASKDVFFETRFSISRFATFRRMRPVMYVNPRVFALGAPVEGLRAIVAHELGHALYFMRGNRLRLLGLAALASPGFNAGFERRTDLVAIERGYGAGLIEFRKWLYANLDQSAVARKKRDYFTAEEIRMIVDASPDKRVFDALRRKTPRNPDETSGLLACRASGTK